jgi:MoxR-like ATPase
VAVARILVGVTGGIAAYKACELVRLLVKAGHDVTPLVTRSADRFVRAKTFFALARKPRGDDPYPHLARADLYVIAPLTANTLAKLARGLADNLVTEAALAHRGPLVLAPAMNPRMWAHAATRANVAVLRDRGAELVGPDEGELAEGEWGVGRMAEPEEILARIDALLAKAGSLAGKRVLVTAGGTREPLDQVRFVGNRSSGRMGVALAEEARRRGADVTLVAANLAVAPPGGVTVVEAPTAGDVAREVLGREGDVLVMASRQSTFSARSAAWRRPGLRWWSASQPSTAREGSSAPEPSSRPRARTCSSSTTYHGRTWASRRSRTRSCSSSPTANAAWRRHRKERSRPRSWTRSCAYLRAMDEPVVGSERVELAAVAETPAAIVRNLDRVVRAPEETLRLVVLSLLSEGHVIIEDLPGVGKTTLAKALARSLDCSFSRLQFTPDLLPSDVTGVNVFNQRSNEFEFRPGPVFANLLLVDEINRASPKTQSALLECMQERQVTIDGVSYGLERPFMVMATQNPIEYEGTYPLPEAQLDRFTMRVAIGYPTLSEEARMLTEQTEGEPLETLEPVTSASEVVALVDEAKQIYVEESLNRYVVALLRHTRGDSRLYLGASPRAGIALLRVAKANALFEGRDFLVPDDVKSIAQAVLGHRLIVSPEARAAGTTSTELVRDALDKTPVPV